MPSNSKIRFKSIAKAMEYVLQARREAIPVPDETLIYLVRTFPSQFNKFYELFPSMSEDVLCAAVGRSPLNLKYIKNPTFNVCYVAVYMDGAALQYVEHQSEELCRVACQERHPRHRKQNGFQYVKNPTDELIDEVLYKDASQIRFMKNPKEKHQLLAIKHSAHRGLGNIIVHIKNPTLKAQQAALERGGHYAVGSIKKPHPKIIQYLVNEGSPALEYTPKGSLTIDQQRTYRLKYAEKNPRKHMFDAYSHLNWIDSKLQLEIISQDKTAYRHINNPTKTAAKLALMADINALHWCIKHKHHDKTFQSIVLNNYIKESNDIYRLGSTSSASLNCAAMFKQFKELDEEIQMILISCTVNNIRFILNPTMATVEHIIDTAIEHDCLNLIFTELADKNISPEYQMKLVKHLNMEAISFYAKRVITDENALNAAIERVEEVNNKRMAIAFCQSFNIKNVKTYLTLKFGQLRYDDDDDDYD